ncbi:MAG: acyl-CoA synthase [Actinomycetales bacterium]|nr:acyl-CoA synthase [Actinomycetales bacterium]
MSIDVDRVIAMEAREFGAWVDSLTQTEVRSVSGPGRERLLDHVFGGIPRGFQADRAVGRSARVTFRITADSQPDLAYAVVIEDGICHTEKEPTDRGGGTLRLGLLEFLRLITGRSNPVKMVVFGKIAVSGDLSQVMAFPKWFHMPR